MSKKIDYNGFNLDIDLIARFTFNQPKISVFSTAVLNDFIKAFETLKSIETVKVVIITSEGKHFLAGANIKEMYDFTEDDAEKFSRLFHRAMNSVENFPKPVIAAVNGYALGGGCELILACDLVVASDTAVFGQPEINLGIIPGAGGTQRLPARVGNLMAKEMILTGRNVFASEALSIGLVNKVVPHQELLNEVMALAKDISLKPEDCVERAKALIDKGSMEDEIVEFSKLFLTGEHKKLMSKFVKE